MACTRSSPTASSSVRGGSTSSASDPSGSRATTIRAPATRCSTPTRSSSSSSASTTTSRRRRRRSSAPTWNRTSATASSSACNVIRAAAAAVLLAGRLAQSRVATAAPARRSTTCIEDDQVPTPPGYNGWERSSVVAWEAVEAQGGIVPDIEEDRTHFPPAWLRYPSPLRSADLLAQEARKPKGLYTKVEPADVAAGDVVVRVKGAGACGKMAVVAGRSDDAWVVLDTTSKDAPPPPLPPPGAPVAAPPALPSSAPVFFDGARARPETTVYRIAVKQDSSLGHVRSLTRDL